MDVKLTHIVWCSDGGVGQLTAGFAPSVNFVAVGDCELDLVDAGAVAVGGDGFRAGLGHEGLVVGGAVFF